MLVVSSHPASTTKMTIIAAIDLHAPRGLRSVLFRICTYSSNLPGAASRNFLRVFLSTVYCSLGDLRKDLDFVHLSPQAESRVSALYSNIYAMERGSRCSDSVLYHYRAAGDQYPLSRYISGLEIFSL